MFTRDEAQKLARKVIGFSTFPECEVTIAATEQAYTRFANNGITTASLSLRRDVSISVTRDSRTGVHAIDDLDDASLRAAVRKAEELAMIAPANPEHMPPVGPQPFPEIDNFNERTATARAADMIPHVKTIIDAAGKRKLVAAGLIERSHRVTAIANKAGLFGFHNSSDSQLTTTIRMADGSSSGWAGQPAALISDIDSAKLANTAIEKCVRWKNPRKLDPGNYTVVLEPTAAGDLIRLISLGFSARNTDEGRTFLSKKGEGNLVGEKLFPEFITLRSDPFDPRQPSLPWTSELLPTRAITWIDKGVVANLAYDRYWASKTGKEPTLTVGPFNPAGSLAMEGGDASLDTLIQSVERGILITHFWYIRVVNPQTREMFVLVPMAEYERLTGAEEFDDSPWTDEERDRLRWEACQMLDSFGKEA